MPTLVRALIIPLLMAVVLTGGSVRADIISPAVDIPEDQDHEGDKINSIRIPVNITLLSWHERPYGLRLRLAGTFATNDLDGVLDGEIDKINVSSFMPGLEIVIPVGKNHILRPHFDLGVGLDSTTERLETLVALGLRTEFVFAGKHYFAGLEPGFKVDNRPNVDLEDDLVFSPFLTLSGRRVLGFTIAGHQPDAGVFIETGYDFNALELTSVRSTRDAVKTQYEVGVGFGFSQSRPKIWIISMPRIRVGYRFGDLEGFRIRIGGDWLNSVVGLNQLTP